MPIYISPQNEYPRYVGDIQIEYPEWDPSKKLPNGWTAVNPVSIPEILSSQALYEDFPVKENGEYFQNFIVRDLTEEELFRTNARDLAKDKLAKLGLSDFEIKEIIDLILKGEL
jgi:hypothetical protein